MRDPPERCKPPAVLSTHLEHPCEQRLAWCGRRWTMAVTGEAARAQLGRATQRQGKDRALARTTPALMRLSSIMTLTAHLLIAKAATGVRSTAGYDKTCPTVSEAMALVRRQWWDHRPFATPQHETDLITIPRALLERCTAALC